MNTLKEYKDFTEFLENQIKPTKPTPKEVEWARKRFSSRKEPPKT